MFEDNVQQEVVLVVGEGLPEPVLVIPLGQNRYRLDATPLGLFSDVYLYWEDIIEADFHEDGSLYFTRVVERGPFEHKDYCLSRKVVESAEFEQLVHEIISCGGLTEIVMGGCFWCHLPKNCSIDVDAQLEHIYETASNGKHS